MLGDSCSGRGNHHNVRLLFLFEEYSLSDVAPIVDVYLNRQMKGTEENTGRRWEVQDLIMEILRVGNPIKMEHTVLMGLATIANF